MSFQLNSPAPANPAIPTVPSTSSLPNTAENDSSSSSSIAILSPPLSPYPTLATTQQSDKEKIDFKQLVTNNKLEHKKPIIPKEAIKSVVEKNQAQPDTSDYKISKRVNPATTKSTADKGYTKFITNCYNSYNKDRTKYFEQEREILALYQFLPLLENPSIVIVKQSGIFDNTRHDLEMAKRKDRLLRSIPPVSVRSSRYDDLSSDGGPTTRYRAQQQHQHQQQTVNAGAPRSAVSRGRPRTPVSLGLTRPSTPRGAGRKPLVHRVSSASRSPAPSRVHETPYEQLVDYSPLVSTLPPGKSLKAEWKGAPMDLSTDPNVGLLHPAEIHLASVLRLSAESFIDSKKRIFAEKVHRLRNGLPFRRTDSQKACRIDVNKASRLFSAFEKVGWLEDRLFEQYL